MKLYDLSMSKNIEDSEIDGFVSIDQNQNITIDSEEHLRILPRLKTDNHFSEGINYLVTVGGKTYTTVFGTICGKPVAYVEEEGERGLESEVVHFTNKDSTEKLRKLRKLFEEAINYIEDGNPGELILSFDNGIDDPLDDSMMLENIKTSLERIEKMLEGTPVISATFPQDKKGKKLKKIGESYIERMKAIEESFLNRVEQQAEDDLK